MSKLAILIGFGINSDLVTGGERQSQVLIQALKLSGYDVVSTKATDVLKEISKLAKEYKAKDITIISDYSQRFANWKINWHLRNKGYKVVCIVGAFYFDYRHSFIKNAIDYIVSKLYLKYADLIFTTGKAVDKRLNEIGIRNKKIVAVYPALRDNLVKLSKLECNSKPAEFEVLTVGRFHPVKGYDYLIDAILLLGNEFHFSLVGDFEKYPEYTSHIMERIKENKIEDRITLYGRINKDEELAELYKKAWCCLHTSVWESSPITVCEPLLFGRPVIATNVGGTSEYLTDGYDSILVPPKDGNAIARALEKLKMDAELYRKFSSNAKKTADSISRRTWVTVRDEYREFL